MLGEFWPQFWGAGLGADFEAILNEFWGHFRVEDKVKTGINVKT